MAERGDRSNCFYGQLPAFFKVLSTGLQSQMFSALRSIFSASCQVGNDVSLLALSSFPTRWRRFPISNFFWWEAGRARPFIVDQVGAARGKRKTMKSHPAPHLTPTPKFQVANQDLGIKSSGDLRPAVTEEEVWHQGGRIFDAHTCDVPHFPEQERGSLKLSCFQDGQTFAYTQSSLHVYPCSNVGAQFSKEDSI